MPVDSFHPPCMSFAPIPHIFACLPRKPVDYTLRGPLQAEKVPRARQSGSDRVRGPQDNRPDRGVEQS
eukprot:3446158-Alexandrium_andersonii.AAC.1